MLDICDSGTIIPTQPPTEPYQCPQPEAMKPCFCSPNDVALEVYCESAVSVEEIMSALQAVGSDPIDRLVINSVTWSTIEANTFANLIIYSLFITRCNVTMVDEQAFAGLENKLHTLQISTNLLTAVPTEIKRLNNLIVLDLSENNIQLLQDNAFPVSLKHLNLRRNSIPCWLGNTFADMTELVDINLETNQIATILMLLREEDKQLPSLETFNLADNNIESIVADAFKSASQLTYLYLQKNQISHNLMPGMFIGLENLQQLYLDDNVISALPSGAFQHAKSLKSLYIRNNEIKALSSEVFDSLSALLILDLSSNNIEQVEEMALQLSSLQILHLSMNNITRVCKDAFLNMDELLEVRLDYNLMNYLLENSFNRAAMPKVISLFGK